MSSPRRKPIRLLWSALCVSRVPTVVERAVRVTCADCCGARCACHVCRLLWSALCVSRVPTVVVRAVRVTCADWFAFRRPWVSGHFQMFRLLCPDGSTQTVDAYRGCHWGSVPSNLVMTSATRGSLVAAGYRKLLTQAVAWFGPAGTHHHHFQLFRSNRSYSTDEYHYVLSRRNQMFSDETRRLLDVSDQTYTQWVGE